jgi:hypothetical protein
MANRVVEMVGKVFGQWIVLRRGSTDELGRIHYHCQCACGVKREVLGSNLRHGQSRSCGHQSGTLRHGHQVGRKRSPTLTSFIAMLRRCLDPKFQKFPRYGGAGVKVTDRWNPRAGGSFENFLDDMGERPVGKTLGRWGDVGNYELGNVVWMTRAEQETERRKRRALTQAA